MAPTKIPRTHYKIMPWKNGLGETAEIDRVPGGDGAYLWRLSQASIQGDGPFSVFAGYDRWLAIWQGDSILLNDVKVSPLTPIRFSGDLKTFCRLEGTPVLDVGLIFDRSRVDASMIVVQGNVNVPQSGVHYIFDFNSGDTLKLTDGAKMNVNKSFLISIWEIGVPKLAP